MSVTPSAVAEANDWLLTNSAGETIRLSEIKTADELNDYYELVEEGDTTPTPVLSRLLELAIEFGDYDAASMWFTIGGFYEFFTAEEQAEIFDIGNQWLRGSEVRDAFQA